MGFEYAFVHLKYTIPPAIVLSLLYRPFFRPIDLYKICFLITVAVSATIPWDSYLIRRKIWTYPPSVIVGPRLFQIPAEELFFFVIQTYNTTLLYLILNKPIFHPNYLGERSRGKKVKKVYGTRFLQACVLLGAVLVWKGEKGTYLGLILAWAAPVALFLWTMSSEFLVNLPLSSTLLPIALPTLYLWVVDTLALRRGTWSIETGTKLGVQIWEGLEIEEAAFFLVTNLLIVFGLASFDHALAILLSFPDLFPEVAPTPSPKLLMIALFTDPAKYDWDRLEGLREAVDRLQKKSRSFYLASSTFSGRLKIDLILLYSFCRVGDDLVDNATTKSEAREWIRKLNQFLDLAYASKEAQITSRSPGIKAFISENFPEDTQSALHQLPTHILPYGPLYELLEGFRTDLEFSVDPPEFPIVTYHDLETYGFRVAGTVAELCLGLVFYHNNAGNMTKERDQLIRAGGRMGIALQYINIARDIVRDAAIGRVYIPTTWLKECGLTPEFVLAHPDSPKIEELRERVLKKGFGEYNEARTAIAKLPSDARGPMRVAVESYMEIGRVLREAGYVVKEGKATVPKSRRIRVAWNALSEG